MKVQCINIEGVPTKILSWGQSVGESFEQKEIVLLITGNPGISGFYVTFLATLFQFLQGTPVWAIGHAGHDVPDEKTDHIPRLKQNKHLYDLKGQINHKVEFIRQHIPSDVKVHLIGHSIGAYISLQLLKRPDIKAKIHHSYLLFPTFEYMADSPNGKLYISIVQKCFKAIYFLSKLVSILPLLIQKTVVTLVLRLRSIPSQFTSTVLVYIRPNVLSKIIFMADDEMEKIKEPDYGLIEENKEQLTFFYSTTDGWTPITYYERLISRIPEIKAEITDQFDHAFVLKSSKDMGELVAKWIQRRKYAK